MNLKKLRLHVAEELLVRFHFKPLSVVKLWVGSVSCVRSNLESVEVIAVKGKHPVNIANCATNSEIKPFNYRDLNHFLWNWLIACLLQVVLESLFCCFLLLVELDVLGKGFAHLHLEKDLADMSLSVHDLLCQDTFVTFDDADQGKLGMAYFDHS